ncbi:hypothetical protein GCM10011571_17500 [Marinithermofilum abyssi]|uniref:Uncharacterized protein n=1 Tax=Marinithermofilum abyssi TaxID=1571185 RepID=A0A8J2VDQ8_9BACL|nr:hypothetical protein [Marinithermofilum abyssi]GGE16327.1 hypothetical protein GCM10011571_17500 [Marinithermofilum abyssi]
MAQVKQLPQDRPQPKGLITPAASVEQTLEQFHIYQQMKSRLGTTDDFQNISGKQHPKKSFVRKVQRFFNVSCEIIQDEPLIDPKTGKMIAWLAKARATHVETGAYQEADGSCGFEEKVEKQRTLHNVRAHAITRAKNRAILDLVGFGEVSAEEIAERSEHHCPPQQSFRETGQRAQGLATEAQRRKIFAMGQKEKGLTENQLRKLVKYQTGKTSTSEMTKKEASELIKLMIEMSGAELVQLIGEKALGTKLDDLPEAEVINGSEIQDDELKELGLA